MNSYISIFKRYFHAAAFITGCFFVSACENDQTDIDAINQRVKPEEARNIESFLSQEGMVRAKLTAPLMLRTLSTSNLSDTVYVEFPKALHVDFYNDSARIETWLDSKYGKYYENQNKVYLRDSVIVINIKGDTLRCPDLWWDQDTKLFYTEKYSEYHTKDRHIYGGKGLEATQDMNSVTFKDATGILGVPKDGIMQ